MDIGSLLRNLLIQKSEHYPAEIRIGEHSLFNGLQDVGDFRQAYELGKTIGQGGFGVVCLATHKVTGVKYACKIIAKARLQDSSSLRQFRTEAEIHMHLSGHRSVVSIVDCFEDTESIYLIEELCTGGTLLEYVMKNERCSEEAAAEFIRGILEFVHYCHRLGVCHRDIKLENFLFSDTSKNPTLKATDFGLSCFMDARETRSDVVGTVHYTAPEVFQGSYSWPCDLWSCGVILYALLSGLLPFSHQDPVVLAKYVMKAPIDMENGPWRSVSAEAKCCVRAMLDRNPLTRATADKMLSSPWIQQGSSQADRKLEKPVLRRLGEFGELSLFKRRLYNCLVADVPEDCLQGLRNMFDNVDVDGDGMISKADLMEFSSWRGVPFTEEEINQTFQWLDVEGDGTISSGNFLAGMINRALFHNSAMARIAFNHLDVDGNGYVNRDHLAAFLRKPTTSSCVDEVLQAADFNLDGVIDLREFMAFWLNRPITSIAAATDSQAPHLVETDSFQVEDIAEEADFGDKLKKALVNNFAKMPTKVLNYLEPNALLARLGLGDVKPKEKSSKLKS